MARKFWTPKRVAEFGHVVASYNSIVRRLTREMEGVKLPLEVSASEERATIKDYDEYRVRVNQLKRLSKSVNPDAQDIVYGEGGPMLKYLRRELSYAKRAVNEKREKKRKELYPYWDGMSKVQRAVAQATSNITKINLPVEEMDGEDLQNLRKELSEGSQVYIHNYLMTWNTYHNMYEGYDEVVLIINLFMEKNPEALELILDGPDEEKEIDYIYLTASEMVGEGLNTHHVSANLTPVQTKRVNVLNFWRRMAASYGIE